MKPSINNKQAGAKKKKVTIATS
jgi:hypothetical protein